MVGNILAWAIQGFIWLLFIRFGIDLVRSVNPSWRPRNAILVILEILMTITDVPLKAIRRFVKPVRVGPLAFDLAWTALFFAAIVLRSLATRLPF